MKHLKLFAVILFVAVISLTACKKNDTPDDGDKGNTTGTSLTEVESWIKEQYKDNLIIDDFNPLPTTYKETEVKIEWTSSNPKRIDETGKIVSRDVKKITDMTLSYTITNEADEVLSGDLEFKLYPRTFAYMQSQFEGQFPARLAEDMSDYLETEFNDFFTITWTSSN